jgi:hypothetical protein
MIVASNYVNGTAALAFVGIDDSLSHFILSVSKVPSIETVPFWRRGSEPRILYHVCPVNFERSFQIMYLPPASSGEMLHKHKSPALVPRSPSKHVDHGSLFKICALLRRVCWTTIMDYYNMKSAISFARTFLEATNRPTF